MTDPRIIHGAGGLLFVVIDGVARTPDELRQALARPDMPRDTARLLAAADALRDAALALPRAVMTYQIRAALAQYRAARKTEGRNGSAR